MDTKKLVAEGERLARPCLHLSPDSRAGRMTGIWGGAGVLEPPAGPFTHWFTIDCRWLATQGMPLEGLLGVYANEDDCNTGAVVHDPGARLPARRSRLLEAWTGSRAQVRLAGWANHPQAFMGVALYGRESASFPPIDAVFKYGDKIVKSWLRSLGLPSKQQWDPYFQARQAAESYEDEYRKRCPLFDRRCGTAIQLGGWHLPWPEGDWEALLKHRLVATTFWNSEPWLEIWMTKSGSFRVLQRIT